MHTFRHSLLYTCTLYIERTTGVERKITKLNQYQKSVLETAFAIYPYANKTTLKELALQTGISEKQVNVWFKNKRSLTKLRKSEGAPSFSEGICC